jgi:hypothetical protein
MRGCGLDWSDSDVGQEAGSSEQCIEPFGDTACEQLLTGWWPVNFSRTTLLQGVGWLVSLIILCRLFCYMPSRHRGEVALGGIALPPLDFGARRVWVGNCTPWQLYLQEGDWVFILQESGWASGPVCMGTKTFVPLHQGSYPRLSTL